MEWNIDRQWITQGLEWPAGKIDMVLDTDTYNEVDDQFALAYALASSEKMDVQAVYAAPFHNSRSNGPGDGMERSYKEILRIMEKMGKKDYKSKVFKGSDRYLGSLDTPCDNPAVQDLISKAMAHTSGNPLYVAAIGAITNVASAILLKPEITSRIVVIWLGGNALHWHTAEEFNLSQDIPASRLLFDCGVPVVHIPCQNVASHLITTVPELEKHLEPSNEIGRYLTEIVREYSGGRVAWSKVIWDISTIAWLNNTSWVKTVMVNSPILTDQHTWSFDNRRHPIRTAYAIDRDAIFYDVFKKLSAL